MRLSAREQRAIPQLRTAVMRLSRRLRQERDEDLLTPSQLAVLANLSLHGALTPGELATMEHVRPPTMSRIIGSLEDEHWVTKRPHPQDGRQCLIELTPKATDWIATYRQARDHWLQEQLIRLDPQEREQLLAAIPLLERLVEPERRSRR